MPVIHAEVADTSPRYFQAMNTVLYIALKGILNNDHGLYKLLKFAA